MTNNTSQITAHLIEFLNASPSPFHAVIKSRQWLQHHDFQELREADAWNLDPGGKYYVVRDDATIAAWIQGTEPTSEAGLRIIGAHTDSPNLRVKPQPLIAKQGYLQLGVEIYGGVLLASWTDRDLGMAGRVFVRGDHPNQIKRHWVNMDRPLLRVPQLAIHLNQKINQDGLQLNKQTHMVPVFALADQKENGPNKVDAFRALLASEIQCEASQILSWELGLYDVQPAAWLGQNREFIVSGRLDNLVCCHAALHSLLDDAQQSSKTTRMVALFDHEEIGSVTTRGARSNFMHSLCSRIGNQNSNQSAQAFARAMAKSIFISADMAHAVHPNYSEQHDSEHMPQINQGPVLKVNVGGSYTSAGPALAQFEAICQQQQIPLQRFVNRNDLRCGSTIGPGVASSLGIASLDAGVGMLSMHSAREMCGSKDPELLVKAFREFLLSDFQIG